MADIDITIDETFENRDGGTAQRVVTDLPNRDTHDWNVNITWPCTRCGCPPDAPGYAPCPGGTYIDPDTGVVLL